MGKYICRAWTLDIHGWTSEFEWFQTKQEAVEYGEYHVSLKRSTEIDRDFEVYEV